MPTDLLLPAFALTLLANAALVAMAIRGMLRARDDRRTRDRSLRVAVANRPVTASVATAEPTPATDPPVGPESRRRTTPKATKSATVRREPSVKPPARKRPSDATSPRSETGRGGRRRFSLPPLDEDHERINRSIETFLSGGESGDAPGPEAVNPTVATTVALVAIDRLAGDGTVPDAPARHGEALHEMVATVERTLRDAARSADRVSAAGPGRFRVILPATGELAARAYLRRVRATVGPSLEAADAPLGLVTATATVLDDDVGVAVAQAEGRLSAALASAARRAPVDESRVALD